MQTANYFFRGLKLITQPGLRRYVIIPLLLNIVLFSTVLWLSTGYIAEFIDWLLAKIPQWLQWLEWILYVLFGVVALLLVFYTFSIIANIIAAPFNSYLADAVYKKLALKDPSEPQLPFTRLVVSSIANEVKKLFYMLAWTIPILILFVIPVVNVAAPFIWFAFTAWMLALEYLDYPMGINGMTFSQQRAYLRKYKVRVFSFGCFVSIATMIPIVNFLVIPTAVAGATALWVEKLSDKQ